MTLLLAQAAGLAGTVGLYLIIAIVVIAIVAIFVVFARQAGIAIPPFVITILWIVGAAILAVVAIKIILSLL